MTFDEWNSLGLYQDLNTWQNFEWGLYRSFYAVEGTVKAKSAAGHAHPLGQFDTQEQAETVSLTLRITNLR